MRMNSRNYYSVNMTRAIVVANQKAARVKTLTALYLFLTVNGNNTITVSYTHLDAYVGLYEHYNEFINAL